MTEEDFWGRPFATGPVRVDPDADAARAKVVREALMAVAVEPGARGTVVAHSLRRLAHYANDTTLAKLGRLLK